MHEVNRIRLIVKERRQASNVFMQVYCLCRVITVKKQKKFPFKRTTPFSFFRLLTFIFCYLLKLIFTSHHIQLFQRSFVSGKKVHINVHKCWEFEENVWKQHLPPIKYRNIKEVGLVGPNFLNFNFNTDHQKYDFICQVIFCVAENLE